MSYGYGNSNPYDDRGAVGYDQNPSYGNSGYAPNSPTGPGYSANVEMDSLTRNAGPVANSAPKSILDRCSQVIKDIGDVDKQIDQMRGLQQRALNDADSSSNSANNRQLDALSTDIMAEYRRLTQEIRLIKSDPAAQSSLNTRQVQNADGQLKKIITKYQQVESEYRGKCQDQMRRQYLIVRPDASEDEVNAAVDDPNGGQIFSQAMMQSDRQGRARAALSAVQDRHAAIQKIEQQMVELSQLFQDMDTLVVQQEAAVQDIEAKAEEVTDNLDKGNDEIGVAVNTARKTRKKKWMCLGLCVVILVVIAIILVIYFVVVKGGNNNNNNSKPQKRDLLQGLEALPYGRVSRIMRRTFDDKIEPFGRVFRESGANLPRMNQ